MTADTITAADIRINARWLIPIEPAGTVLEHYAVIIQGDRLAAVIPQEQADRSFRTRETVDLPNHVVMPGLINMHTHFSLSLPGQAGEAVEAMGPGELALYMADGAARTLRNGVTTVRCVAEKGGLDFALRRAIDAGHVLGPSIRTAGLCFLSTASINTRTPACHGWPTSRPTSGASTR